jgi:hypothetical protein
MIARRELKQKLRQELLQQKSFLPGMLELLSLYKEDKILIFKQINLLKS